MELFCKVPKQRKNTNLGINKASLSDVSVGAQNMEDMEENEEGPGGNVVITSIPNASTFFGRGHPDEEEDEDCEEEEKEEEEEGRDEEEEDDEDEDDEEEYDGRLEDGDTLVEVGNGEYIPARALHAMLRMIYDRRLQPPLPPPTSYLHPT
jgi:hypothetical protein